MYAGLYPADRPRWAAALTRTPDPTRAHVGAELRSCGTRTAPLAGPPAPCDGRPASGARPDPPAVRGNRTRPLAPFMASKKAPLRCNAKGAEGGTARSRYLYPGLTKIPLGYFRPRPVAPAQRLLHAPPRLRRPSPPSRSTARPVALSGALRWCRVSCLASQLFFSSDCGQPSCDQPTPARPPAVPPRAAGRAWTAHASLLDREKGRIWKSMKSNS